MVIIGIDPGTSRIGYGVIRKGRKIKVLDYGIISTKKNIPQEKKLVIIEKEFRKLLRKYKPKYLAVESLFFFKNLKTAMKVSEARGVIILEAEKKGLKIIEISPLQVKNTITGYGRATKDQVQRMIKKRLNLKEIPRPDDAADALSIAFCASFLVK